MTENQFRLTPLFRITRVFSKHHTGDRLFGNTIQCNVALSVTTDIQYFRLQAADLYRVAARDRQVNARDLVFLVGGPHNLTAGCRSGIGSGCVYVMSKYTHLLQRRGSSVLKFLTESFELQVATGMVVVVMSVEYVRQLPATPVERLQICLHIRRIDCCCLP